MLSRKSLLEFQSKIINMGNNRESNVSFSSVDVSELGGSDDDEYIPPIPEKKKPKRVKVPVSTSSRSGGGSSSALLSPLRMARSPQLQQGRITPKSASSSSLFSPSGSTRKHQSPSALYMAAKSRSIKNITPNMTSSLSLLFSGNIWELACPFLARQTKRTP